MESTRALGYSLESAVADILDNSISADATEIKIEFWPLEHPYLYILDNGNGMVSQEITKAMQYGSQSPLDKRSTNDMGRFGLGLKTASLSQCRCLTVITMKDDVLSARQWNLDFVLNSKSWSLLSLDRSEINDYPGVSGLIDNGKGTLVVWQQFDRIVVGSLSFEDALSKKMDAVRSHIALVFHRFIFGEPGIKRISIYLNNKPIEPIDPFLSSKSEQIMDIEPIEINGVRIAAVPYILPHVSRLTPEELSSLGGEDGLRKKQGFYVYRNKRLLVWGTWFRMLRQDELYKLARVKVDIPNSLDILWNLDIRKSTAIPTEIVKRNLERIVNRIADRSKRTWTWRGRKETRNDVGHIWERYKTREGIRYLVNRDHPFVELICKTLGSEKSDDFEQLIKLIENGLPLNIMYLDMTEDKHFSTDTDSETRIRQLALKIVRLCGKDQKRILEQLSLLKKYDPFSAYPDVIEQLESEVLKNE